MWVEPDDPGEGRAMKRIDLVYGGTHYSVVGRSLGDLQAEIAAAATTGSWIKVQDGIGPAHLYLSQGVDVALIELPPMEDDPDTDTVPLT